MSTQRINLETRCNIRHSRPFILLMVLPLILVSPTYAKYGGGSGTLPDPYRIATPEQLYEISTHEEDWHKCFKLTADIDLSAYQNAPFNPIGTGYGPDGLPEWGRWYYGVFDGDGHTISNFTHHAPNLNDVGLFGTIAGEVKNLGLVNVDVSGYENIGGLAGVNHDGLVSNCYVTGKVSGQNSVGGMIGRLVAKIQNCYSSAEVSGGDGIAGLVGINDGGLIYNCYATGWATADRRAMGLTGHTRGSVVGSFWDTETTGQAVSCGGHGRTTAEMKTAATYFGWGGCGNEGVWTIDEGKDYPRLAWEGKPGLPIAGQLSDIIPGSGTAADPYLISTAEQLNAIGLFPCERNRYFRLIADIDLSAYKGMEFNRIGMGWPFTGSFDGDRHTILNFTYDSTHEPEAYIAQSVGLFGDIAIGAVVKNLGLVDVFVAGYYDVGGLAAINTGGKISNCYVTGQVSAGNRGGGLIGSNSGTVTESWATASVSSPWVSGLGGLVGMNDGTLTDCYAIAAVSAEPYELYGSGGLAGENAGQVSNCYAAGVVSAPTSVAGGLVGIGVPDTVANSFWDIQTTGQNISAGGTGKATDSMMIRSTFTDAGWDFVGETANGTKDTWSISEGTDYPRLSWASVASGPYPLDGAIFVDPNVTLKWLPSLLAESHDVYFGDNLVAIEAGSDSTFRGNQAETSFTVGLPGTPYPDGLARGVMYYWRINEHNTDGTIVTGPIWSFTVLPLESPEKTVQYQVTASEDDGYAYQDTSQNLDTDFLRIGTSSFANPPYYISGMIFRNVNIPQGIQIIDARLKVRCHSRLTDTVYGMIQAEAADNALALDSSGYIASLPRTNASVNWDLEQPWSANAWYESPDIAEVIQEVINRSGWSENNSLAILYSTRSEGGYRNFSAYDRGSDYAPILEITYIP